MMIKTVRIYINTLNEIVLNHKSKQKLYTEMILLKNFSNFNKSEQKFENNIV